MTDVATAPTIQLARPLSAGAVFAERYEVLSVLGHGGMGSVYRVRDLELAEDVALKILRAEIADAPGALDRFRREVKLARRVTHPNVARTYDLGAHEGSRFITMELIVGDPLSRRVPRGKRIALSDALRVVSEVARGLAAAHAVGVVHRDLKPENVMLTAATTPDGENVRNDSLDGRVVITDFGIARLTDAGERTRTLGQGVGTPAYMSPEQVEGRELDGRADVYALGVVLFELLTGVLPFTGDTPWSVAAARLAAEPVDPRALEASIPEGVARLVLDAMSRTRDRRPDAQAMIDRLDALRGIVPNVPDRAPVPSSAPRSSRADSLAVRSTAIDLAQATPLGPRTVAVAPFAVGGGSVAAHDLVGAIADAISKMRGARVLVPDVVRIAAEKHVHEGTIDAVALGRAVEADLVVDGSLREVSGRVRVRARLVDVAKGEQTWADRFEGSADELFALEDDVVAATVEAVRARTAEAALLGPSNKEAREVWERGRDAYTRFELPAVREAVSILEDGYMRFPDDAWIGSALGAALTRQWLQTGASDRSLITRAEEVTLRALAADASIGQTFNTIGLLRMAQGELRACVRAFQDALARAPLLAEAHLNLGRLLSESGHVEEGLRRLDVALRFEPHVATSWMERARVFALIGDRKRAESDIARAQSLGGAIAIAIFSMRIALWWNDKDLAWKTAEIIEKAQSGGAYEAAPPLLRAWVEGVVHPQTSAIFDRLASASRAAPRHRTQMLLIGAEYWASIGRVEESFALLEQAADLPLTDLLWLDRAEPLAALREDPRFSRVRSKVGARVADLWG